MLKLIILLSFLVLVVNSLPRKHTKDDLIITLNHGGKIRGEEKSKYFSFKGIPYATPPVGDLRLRNPQPHPGWTDILNATEHGNTCVQKELFTGLMKGSEDCLFLNVYTPPNLNPSKKYPVMFWVHGGGFINGNGNSIIYGPDLLVAQDVIVVTINYRLGFLGFFSTNDRFAQGNYGLKDCVEALKWVQNNIEAFGGDRNRVTIFGESAGGTMVHFLILSPMAKGLFHGAISQSGTALGSWSLQPYPKTIALKAAKLLNLTFTSSEDLVKQLQHIEDPYIFVTVANALEDPDKLEGHHANPFSPSVEAEDHDEPRFLYETPLKIIEDGEYNQVPYICGANNEESLSAIYEFKQRPNMLEPFNNDSNILLPYEWFIQPNTAAANEILANIRKIYFNDKTEITDIMDYVRYATDRDFEYAAYKTVELHSKKQTSPVFFYIFSFDGALAYGKKALGLSDYEGAMHTDELGYMWKILNAPAPILPSNPAAIVRKRMVKMWTDFSKYGTPTPEINELITVKWPKVQYRQEYMDIGEELIPSVNPFSRRMEMWKEMDQKYSNAH